MSEEAKENYGVEVEIKMEDAVLSVAAKADLVEIARELAKKSDNTIDDHLVEMLALASKAADWKGYAKQIL